jgi:hypothetical protein
MASWAVYEVIWQPNTPPFAKSLRVANARLRAGDWEAPTLTADKTIYRWRSPLLTAADVYRILYESNAQPEQVTRWDCNCGDWNECDDGLTECGYHRPYRGEDEYHDRCYYFDENQARFGGRPSTKVAKHKRTRRFRTMKQRLKVSCLIRSRMR